MYIVYYKRTNIITNGCTDQVNKCSKSYLLGAGPSVNPPSRSQNFLMAMNPVSAMTTSQAENSTVVDPKKFLALNDD